VPANFNKSLALEPRKIGSPSSIGRSVGLIAEAFFLVWRYERVSSRIDSGAVSIAARSCSLILVMAAGLD